MEKIIYRIFYMLILLYAVPLYSGMRNMIILLDWGNERVEHTLNVSQSSAVYDFGPVTSSLITALWQKAAPILVSVATWKNFVQRKKIYNDFITLSDQQLIEKYKGTFGRFSTDERITTFAQQCKTYISSTQFETLGERERKEISGFLLSFLVPFDHKEWIMEQFGNYFYLLIPKSYLEDQQKKKDYPAEARRFKKPHSDRGRILGLKLGKTVSSPLDLATISAPIWKEDEYQKEFFQILPQIFVTVQDVEDHRGSKEKTDENIIRFLHHWYFYMGGHGGPSQGTFPGTIVGLKSFQFPYLLFFFNNRIQTDFLFYLTCFVGGEHLLSPYEHAWFYPPIKQGSPVRRAIMPEMFNYIIVASTLSYAPVYGWQPEIPFPFALGSSRITFTQFYPTFFQAIKKYFYPEGDVATTLDLVKILDYVGSFLTKEGKLIYSAQTPVIRYPGTEWFSIVNFRNKVFRLSRVLVETKEAEAQEIVVYNKEIIVVDPQQFFGRRKAIDERCNSEILVPVRIKKDSVQTKLPGIISSAAASASHYFDKIIVMSQGGLIEFARSFFRVAREGYGRSYYIKTLVCRNDLTQSQANVLGAHYDESLELNDVIIVVNDRNPFDKRDLKKYNGLIFRYQLQNFAVSWPADDKNGNELFFQQGILPWLNKIEESIPAYPFALPEIKYKNIVEALKQKQAHGSDVQKSPVDVRGLQQELKKLSDKLSLLNRKLAALKT